jgi:Uma2 family endonuclease
MNLSGDGTREYRCTMTVTGAPKPIARGPAVWLLSAQAYHALGEMGLLPEKTELLYGQVFHKMSKTPLHSFLSEFLEDMLRRAVPSECHVRGEEPLTLGDSEPEPDLAVVRGRREDFRQAHPTTAELVIEVCVTSHDFDRSKLRAYAGAGVKECWLVLGPEKKIEVHRQPAGEQFAECAVHGPGGSVTSTAVPGFSVDLDRFFAA